MPYNPRLSEDSVKDVPPVKGQPGGSVFPVYILSRVVHELVDFCLRASPIEALTLLVGQRVEVKDHPGVWFTKITDWVTGGVDSNHISARFTTEGVQQANLFLDERYGDQRERNAALPVIVGVAHSHPFGTEPEFSSIDLDTFLNFPYDAEGNVFVLVDPIPNPPFFKVYKIVRRGEEKVLQRVPWVEYSPVPSHFSCYGELGLDTMQEEPSTEELAENGEEMSLEKEQERLVLTPTPTPPDEGETLVVKPTSRQSGQDEVDNSGDDPLDDPMFNPPKVRPLRGNRSYEQKDKRRFFD